MQLKEFYVVGLGASAGGHQSLKEFFLNLPEQPGAAFVVVTHLHRNHFSILDQMISKFTGMRVVRIAGGEQILPNHVYVMPEKVRSKSGATGSFCEVVYQRKLSIKRLTHSFTVLGRKWAGER